VDSCIIYFDAGCCIHRYEDQGKLDTAIESYKRAMVIRNKMLGEEHPLTKKVASLLARALEMLTASRRS
jgi:hypothetical protein